MGSTSPGFKVNDRVTKTNLDQSRTTHGQITETIGKKNKIGNNPWYLSVNAY